MESATTLLLFYLQTYSPEAEDTSFMSMIITMLEICEEKILAMTDPMELMQYACQARFVEECLTSPELFKTILEEYIVPDQMQYLRDSGLYQEEEEDFFDQFSKSEVTIDKRRQAMIKTKRRDPDEEEKKPGFLKKVKKIGQECVRHMEKALIESSKY